MSDVDATASRLHAYLIETHNEWSGKGLAAATAWWRAWLDLHNVDDDDQDDDGAPANG